MGEARKRIEVFDFMRGLAVFGFMLWHAFDMFYAGNKYDEPLFRVTILTRISFVMVSALVLGLKDWSGYRVRDHLVRTLKLVSFTFLMAILYAIKKSSLMPIYHVFLYIIGGSSDFTFSILISLGCIYLFIPLLLKYFSPCFLAVPVLVIVGATEIVWNVHFPEIVRFLLVAYFFSCAVKINIHLTGLSKEKRVASILIYSIAMFYIAIDKDIYWYIRNYLLLHIAILLLFYTTACCLYANYNTDDLPFLRTIEMFGVNSLFVYIFHYVLYITVFSVLRISSNSDMLILMIWLSSCFLFYLNFKFLKLERIFNKFY